MSSEISTGIRMRTLTSIPKLVAVAGPAAGAALSMSSTLATAGRHPTNDLVLDDPQASAVHLELRRAGERLHVRDAGSTSGTWLGGHRVTDVELAATGEIVVGTTTLRMTLDAEASTAVVSLLQSFGELVGQSTPMRELFATLERVAPEAGAVLVQGEEGTGKEELARALHARSLRAGHPFVVVDAASMPPAMADHLILGHEQGGARHAGFFEAAHGGTVFLDGIGALPASLQSTLVRVLERREVVPVGGRRPVPVDVRLVASARRDLRHDVAAKRFREDLYERVSQVRVVLAPLRDRREDVPLLCQKILMSLPGQREAPILIEQAALDFLATQPWPGNVRELRSVLSRAASRVHDGMLRLDGLRWG
jgi:DNA-binding NtrC family response regulator